MSWTGLLKLEELLASKLKALLQRRHSPDLYDFVYSILFQKGLDILRSEVISTFLKKTIYEPNPHLAKGLLLELPFQVMKGLWERYLTCPKVSLISFDDAENLFRKIVEELFTLIEPTISRPLVVGGGHGRLSHFGTQYRTLIMEAGRLQKILHIVYDGWVRKVEPYSLVYKRRKDGIAREYFYAWDLSGGRSGQKGIKSFIAEKLQSVSMTEESFNPRFPIELTKSGGYFSKPFSTQGARTVHPNQLTRRNPFQFSYTIECPYCSKKFNREKYNTQLNDHKDRYGNPCPGRLGTIVN